MKLFTVFIAVAMLVMVMEGCSRYPEDGQTVGQKLDRVLARTNLAMADVGDSFGSTVETANTAMSSVAATMSENASDKALLHTLDVADAGVMASIKTKLVRDPDISALRIGVEARNGVVSLNARAYD